MTDERSVFETILARDGRLVYKTRGVSMRPMLRQNRDLVIIEPPKTAPVKYDAVLYRRGDATVLHRVIKRYGDIYLIRGDNTFSLERVPADNIFGILTGFVRRKKDGNDGHNDKEDRITSVNSRGYRFYVRFWCAIYPLRAVCAAVRRFGGKVKRKILGLFGRKK